MPTSSASIPSRARAASGYLLEQFFGYSLPAGMREHFSYLCKDISDREHKELKPDEVLEIFESNYLNLPGTSA